MMRLETARWAITPSVCVTAALLCWTPRVAAQDPTQISGVPACSTCRIVLTPVATIGREADAMLLGHGSLAAVNSRGWIYAWGAALREIAVYNSSGEFVRSFGRLGEGPGEFERGGGYLLIGPGDTLHIVQGRRYLVVPPGDSVATRGVRLPGRVSLAAAITPLGQLVWVGSVVTPESIGLSVHVLGSRGQVERSWGGDGTYDRRCTTCLMYAVGATPNPGVILAVPPDRYAIEFWRMDGRLQAAYNVVNSPWSRISEEILRGGRFPQIRDIRQDEDGLVWVTAYLRQIDKRPRPAGGLRPIIGRNPNEDTTVIEVIDLASKRVLATRKFPGYVKSAGGRFVFKVRELSSGQVLLDLWQLSVQR